MSDHITTKRPALTGQPVPLAARIPEELARFLELLSDINWRSKTDEYRVALENHVIAAKSDKRVQEPVQQVMDEDEREAKAKRDVLSSILNPAKPTAKSATTKPPTEQTPAKRRIGPTSARIVASGSASRSWSGDDRAARHLHPRDPC